jgi:hypothetical protein
MGASDPGFETGFPKPSLDNPVLFAKYADAIAGRLRLQYGASAGYRIAVEKHEKDPKKRHWDINVHRGLFDGTQVTIKPASAMPHRAMVEVCWHSRLVDILLKGFVILSLPIFVVIFLALAFSTRLGFAVILTAILFFIWAAIGAILVLIFAKLCSKIFGNQFDYNRRAMMAQEIKGIPLPAQPDSGA